jgi:hypothetical protein
LQHGEERSANRSTTTLVVGLVFVVGSTLLSSLFIGALGVGCWRRTLWGYRPEHQLTSPSQPSSDADEQVSDQLEPSGRSSADLVRLAIAVLCLIAVFVALVVQLRGT